MCAHRTHGDVPTPTAARSESVVLGGHSHSLRFSEAQLGCKMVTAVSDTPLPRRQPSPFLRGWFNQEVEVGAAPVEHDVEAMRSTHWMPWGAFTGRQGSTYWEAWGASTGGHGEHLLGGMQSMYWEAWGAPTRRHWEHLLEAMGSTSWRAWGASRGILWEYLLGAHGTI